MNKSKKKSEKRKNKIELRYYPLFYIFSSLFLVSARYQILLVLLVLLVLSASTFWSRFWLHLLLLTLPLISVIFVCSAFLGLWASHMRIGKWKLERQVWDFVSYKASWAPHDTMIRHIILFYPLVPVQIDALFFIYIKNWLLLLLDRYFIFGLEIVILDLGMFKYRLFC